MKLSFPWMWWLWCLGLTYDVIVSAAGLLPDRSLVDRLSRDADIAWFIFSMWAVVRLVNLSYKIDRRFVGKPSEENAA